MVLLDLKLTAKEPSMDTLLNMAKAIHMDFPNLASIRVELTDYTGKIYETLATESALLPMGVIPDEGFGRRLRMKA